MGAKKKNSPDIRLLKYGARDHMRHKKQLSFVQADKQKDFAYHTQYKLTKKKYIKLILCNAIARHCESRCLHYLPNSLGACQYCQAGAFGMECRYNQGNIKTKHDNGKRAWMSNPKDKR